MGGASWCALLTKGSHGEGVALSKNKTLEKAESVRRVKRVKFGERMGKLGEAEEKGGQERTREKGR